MAPSQRYNNIKTRVCEVKIDPLPSRSSKKEEEKEHYINQRLQSFWRATACKVREEGGKQFQVSFYKMEKIDRLNVGLLPTC